jgi:hypothetical protein
MKQNEGHNYVHKMVAEPEPKLVYDETCPACNPVERKRVEEIYHLLKIGEWRMARDILKSKLEEK